MLYKKEGTPEENELVLCTITNVQHHSVFAKLDEYDNKTGMIHISEVSPGRIRNIRDYVQEGKKVVCKILRVDPVKGHIDLSLRRVNEGQKRQKQDQIKREQKAEKIIETAAKKLDKDPKSLYEEISSHVFKKYEYIYEVFEDVVSDIISLEKLGIDKKLAEDIEEIIKEKIKPPRVEIKGILSLVSYAPEGIEVIKESLKKAEIVEKEHIVIKYQGAGKYGIIVNAPDYKEAEELIEKSTSAVIKEIEKRGGQGSFQRLEK